MFDGEEHNVRAVLEQIKFMTVRNFSLSAKFENGQELCTYLLHNAHIPLSSSTRVLIAFHSGRSSRLVVAPGLNFHWEIVIDLSEKS